MKKHVRILFSALVGVLYISNGALCNENITQLVYGAGTSGSTVNTVVLGQTQILNNYCKNIQITAEASSGGSDNLRYTQDGVFQISTASSTAAYQAVHGEGDFKGEVFDNVKGWIPFYLSYVMIVVPDESNIKRLNDLRGKRVSVGARGSGAEVICHAMFNGAGITYADFKPYFLSTADSNEALIDGTIDVTILATGVPTPALMELMAMKKIRIIAIPEEEAAEIAKDTAFLSAGSIPAGTYEGINYDIPTLQSSTIAYISTEVDETIVYDMTKCIWEHLDELADVHISQKNLNPQMIKECILPIMELHGGAKKYYKEKGWID